jgi:predicted Zn-dependent protease
MRLLISNMLRRALCALTIFALVAPREASAQQSINFIRDAEIESTIRQFVSPVFTVAGLDASVIRIYLVNDARLNAFVAGGQNLFLNTGLLIRSQTPNQVIGVAAHETGHIAGGHLVRSTQAMKNATIESIIGMLLGAGAAVVGHGNGAGGAVIAGETVGQRAFLQYSITQEASADAAALRFLDRTHQSARGLLQFFQILQQEEFLTAQHQDPYLQTHPLTEERVTVMQNHVDHSPYSDAKDPPEWVHLNNLMKAKLGAFLSSPPDVLATIKKDDNSEEARYARAIAYYRVPDLKSAVPIIDGLIRDFPNNPYYQELKGQMLFENGRIAEAVAPYERTVQMRPDEPLFNIELAQVQLETNDPKLVARAKDELTNALRVEADNADAWRFLAVAYGRSGDMGMAALALAEQNMAQGNFREAALQSDRAQKLLPAGAQRQRAQDLGADAKRNRDSQGK